MAHIDRMLSRLPTLYREGELLGQVMALVGVQLESFDEDMVAVQRSHWFDTTRTLEEAALLASILDVAPEPWQALADFRPWVHELRDAFLEHGSVTVKGLQRFVEDYTRRYQDAVDVSAVPDVTAWEDEPSSTRPAFVENPPARRCQRVPPLGGLEPLSRFSLTNAGIADAEAGFLLVGQPSGPERVPVIANLTTGQALVFLGSIPEGQRLWLRATPEHTVEGQLEGTDVTDRLRSVATFTPGTPWTVSEAASPAAAITLRQGENQLWFLTVAHYDVEGLDRFLLALAPLELEQGRWDEVAFDRGLFFQDPGISLLTTWVERRPASFGVDLPAGTLLNLAGEGDAAEEKRDRLGFALSLAMSRLKAAGVRSAVHLHPLRSVQAQRDRLVAIGPLRVREAGPTGGDRLAESGAVFDVTPFDESTIR